MWETAALTCAARTGHAERVMTARCVLTVCPLLLLLCSRAADLFQEKSDPAQLHLDRAKLEKKNPL